MNPHKNPPAQKSLSSFDSTKIKGYGKKKEFNSISQSSISESPENSSVFSEEENNHATHP